MRWFRISSGSFSGSEGYISVRALEPLDAQSELKPLEDCPTPDRTQMGDLDIVKDEDDSYEAVVVDARAATVAYAILLPNRIPTMSLFGNWVIARMALHNLRYPWRQTSSPLLLQAAARECRLWPRRV